MDKVRIWNTVLESLKINLSTANFSTWFPKTFIVRLKTIDKNRQITEIGCPNPFVRNTIEDRYYSLIKEALDQATDKKNNLVFLIKPSIAKPSEAEEIEMQKGTLFEEKKNKIKTNKQLRPLKRLV